MNPEMPKIATLSSLKNWYSLVISRKKSVIGARLSSKTDVTVIAVKISVRFWPRLWFEPKSRLKK